MADRSNSLSAQVLKLLKKNHLMTAPQILTALSKAGKKYNKTSLYRALDKMLSEEKICKLNLGKNQIQYELRGNHHDHLVCTECEKVEITHCNIDHLNHTNNYQIQHHHLTLFGICPNCQRKTVNKVNEKAS